SRIDATSNRVTVRIPTEEAPGVAVGEGGVWVTSTKTGTVTEYDPRGSRVIRSVRVARSADSIVVANGSVWVASSTDSKVIQLDPASGRTLRVIDAHKLPTPSSRAREPTGAWRIPGGWLAAAIAG